jgi:predicted nucleotidyltransferase
MAVVPATVHVPTIDRRERVPDAAIEEFVQSVAVTFRPERIILFGSYAYGQPHPGSDVDLLVVMDTEMRSTAQAVDILRTVEHHFGVDLLVRTPRDIARRADLGDPFILEVLERGRVLYERPHA